MGCGGLRTSGTDFDSLKLMILIVKRRKNSGEKACPKGDTGLPTRKAGQN